MKMLILAINMSQRETSKSIQNEKEKDCSPKLDFQFKLKVPNTIPSFNL